MDIQIEVARGQAVLNHLDALAALRLEGFRDWPYLYEGTLDYERQYLCTYANCPQALCVLAMADGKVVGASTALPLCDEPPEVQAPFLATGWDITRVFYFGESVLLRSFRGLGVGHRFMHARISAARDGGFSHCTFCAVERAADDPRLPRDYRPLQPFWNACGFTRRPELHTTFLWREIGESEESPKPMVFWVKSLVD